MRTTPTVMWLHAVDWLGKYTKHVSTLDSRQIKPSSCKSKLLQLQYLNVTKLLDIICLHFRQHWQLCKPVLYYNLPFVFRNVPLVVCFSVLLWRKYLSEVGLMPPQLESKVVIPLHVKNTIVNIMTLFYLDYSSRNSSFHISQIAVSFNPLPFSPLPLLPTVTLV